MMNIISKIKSTEIRNSRLLVKLLGKGNNDIKTVENLTPFGFESNVPEGYTAIYTNTKSKEEKVLLGIINKEILTAVGESRIFSTDEDGNTVFSIKLKNDGTAEVGGNSDNLARFSKLQEGFDDFAQDFNNFVNDFNQHTHLSAAPGSPTGIPGASVPPIIGQPTNANIDAAKIDEIKSL